MDFSSFGKASSEFVIDCSSSEIKLAVGTHNKKTGLIVLEKVGVVPLENDAINDGAIADSFGVIMALKHAIARLDIKNRSAIVTTEGAFMHTRDLELPKAKNEQLKDMVKYEVMGQGNNKEMNIDYIIYGTAVDEETNAPKLKIRATAVPVETIAEYREFLKNMDLTPVAMDVNPNAIRKLFSSGIINGNVNIAQTTLLLVELSGSTTTVTVLDKGFPVLSRRLAFGHANIRQVAESVKKMQGGNDNQSSLARRLNITKSDAESLIPIEDIDVWHETVAEIPSLQSAVNAYFKSLVETVNRTAQFSISKFHIDSISTCFLYGSGASYKKIDKELSRQLGTNVEVLNTLSTVAGPKDFMLPQFVNCCGALIRED